MLCHSGGPITPQDRADGPGKDAEDQEGCSNKNVIVNKDSLGEEKSQSRQRQGREPPPNSSQLRNGDSSIDDMRMALHVPRTYLANVFNVLAGECGKQEEVAD